MSINISNLVKKYGTQKAIDALTFTVNKGEILGFLGSNGAGKSTTMKIAAGYIGATAGTVEIDGFDIMTERLAAQKRIGYLPEHNSLYLDMYVHEYLHFSAQVYQLTKKQRAKRIPDVIAKCGLIQEQNKKIGQLSKGYRQRIGLAKALLNDPAVLILDEPTTGLDPNQIVEIRKLIKKVSKDKTVIFSTHIMQEVKALCDRVIVIHKGRIIVDQSMMSFSKGLNQEISLKVTFKLPIDTGLLSALPSVNRVTAIDYASYRLSVIDSTIARSAVFQVAVAANLALIELQEEENSLDDIFHSLTK